MKYLNDADGRFKLPLKDDAGKTLCTLLCVGAELKVHENSRFEFAGSRSSSSSSTPRP